jgi:hypothetical protein
MTNDRGGFLKSPPHLPSTPAHASIPHTPCLVLKGVASGGTRVGNSAVVGVKKGVREQGEGELSK